MTLIKQEDNATIIREELRAIDGLYGRFKPPIPDVPCPFTHFLLLSAFSTDLEDEKESYKSSVMALDAKMGSTKGGTDLYPHFFAKQHLILINMQTTTMGSPSSMLLIPKTPPTVFLPPFTMMECLCYQQQGMFAGIILSLQMETRSRTRSPRPTRREAVH
jgi:hypothetical protein